MNAKLGWELRINQMSLEVSQTLPCELGRSLPVALQGPTFSFAIITTFIFLGIDATEL